jgi:hypothetical protein
LLARTRLGDRAEVWREDALDLDQFAAAVVAGVRLPLDYVRLNVSAVRGQA